MFSVSENWAGWSGDKGATPWHRGLEPGQGGVPHEPRGPTEGTPTQHGRQGPHPRRPLSTARAQRPPGVEFGHGPGR